MADFEKQTVKCLPEKYFTVSLRKTANGKDVPEKEIVGFLITILSRLSKFVKAYKSKDAVFSLKITVVRLGISENV